MRTREMERDYARYGAARRSPARLPGTASETMDFALRALRENLGSILSASLVPAMLFVLAVSYTITFALPSIGQTSSPGSIARQVAEFALAILIALSVALPLVVLALAGLSVVALETARDWARLPKHTLPQGIAPYGLAARIIGWSLLLSLRIFFVGFALLLIAGLLLAVMGPDAIIPGIFGVIGGLVAIFGFLAAIYLFSRSSLAVPAGLYEGLTPRRAFARAKALGKGRQSLAIAGTSTESSIVIGGLLSLLLIYGVHSIAEGFGVNATILNLFSSPLARATVGEAVRILPAFLAAIIVLPYVSLVNAMSYFERRAMVEGFDIELMSDRLAKERR